MALSRLETQKLLISAYNLKIHCEERKQTLGACDGCLFFLRDHHGCLLTESDPHNYNIVQEFIIGTYKEDEDEFHNEPETSGNNKKKEN